MNYIFNILFSLFFFFSSFPLSGLTIYIVSFESDTPCVLSIPRKGKNPKCIELCENVEYVTKIKVGTINLETEGKIKKSVQDIFSLFWNGSWHLLERLDIVPDDCGKRPYIEGEYIKGDQESQCRSLITYEAHEEEILLKIKLSPTALYPFSIEKVKL